jgi:predicted component of type VI protein secretion system
MTFLRAKKFGFTAGKHHFTPIYEQSKYKYLVYVDGHCAACRYGFMMRLGSVILKVEPRQVADRMWYFPLLKPYHDHVPVKPDLSDLEEKIKWCREHDDKCRQIGENAKQFYAKYVGTSALLDYVEMACKNIAKRSVEPPAWWKPPPAEEAPPKLQKPDVPCYEDRATHQSRLCTRCQEDADVELKELEQMQSEAANERESTQEKKKRLRAVMRERAQKKKAKTS